ncbi:MAG: urate oxidase [Chthoniobacter sp.]|jgi:urate oxidase|nr:urate oxidase [Chthoniobacter sp.]
MKLAAHRYGKSRVRVLKVRRDGEMHTIKELAVDVAFSGDFERSYIEGDNRQVVPTDTIKNTVHVLAKEQLGPATEPFAVALAQHFIARYPQVHQAEVEARERVWERLTFRGAAHAHSFTTSPLGGRPFARVIATAGTHRLESGFEDLLILKSTQSGFEGFPQCEFTTLPETSDRIFATALTATWTWNCEPADYHLANAMIRDALLEPFALHYSPSVQATLFQMGEAALKACPEISQIHLAAPNQHCLRADLSPFGIENANDLFVPTDEPHGQIEAIIARDE